MIRLGNGLEMAALGEPFYSGYKNRRANSFWID